MSQIVEKRGDDGNALLKPSDIKSGAVVLEDSNSYTRTWKEDISLAVQEGIEQGQSVGEIKDNVKQFFIDQSDYRAERIARSETVSAYNAGNLDGYILSQGLYSKPISL